MPPDYFLREDSEVLKQDINLGKLVVSSLRGIDSRLPYYISVTTGIDKNLHIYGDEKQLRTVFLNILTNAIDAIESKGVKDRECIEIEASEVKEERFTFVKISFSNSGPHIPESDLKNIFDPFFSTRDPGKGVGLGLSVSYMIVKDHGGRMDIENDKDLVRIHVTLPLS